jgi:flagellar basal-body rod protein FlgF
MYTGLYTAAAGSMVEEKRLAVLTNNLANATTAGYKSDKSVFHSVLVPLVVGEVQPPDSSDPVVTSVDPLMNLYRPQHPRMTVVTDFSQGILRETGNAFDVALEGQGFMAVEGPNQEVAYTRQGTFSLNSDGLLVTQNGWLVQGEGGPLIVSGGKLEIDPTGRVSVDGNSIGRLKLVNFTQPYPLEKMEGALFRATALSPQIEEPSDLIVHQGAIEFSNSPSLRLLGAVIRTSRAYEIYQRTIKIFDETAGRAVNDIAKT